MVRGVSLPPASRTRRRHPSRCRCRFNFCAKVRVVSCRNSAPARRLSSIAIPARSSRSRRYGRRNPADPPRIRDRSCGFHAGTIPAQNRGLDEGGIVTSATAAFEAASRFQDSAETLDQVLRVFLGLSPEHPLPVDEPAHTKGIARFPAVIRMNATAAGAKQLERHGYTRQHRFAVLPSRTQPRWLLPLAGDGRAIDGFELYTPYSPLTRLLKALVVGARATGWNVWARRNLLVAARAPLALEKLATEVTGEKNVTFAFSIGTPGSVQKFTIQLMD